MSTMFLGYYEILVMLADLTSLPNIFMTLMIALLTYDAKKFVVGYVDGILANCMQDVDNVPRSFYLIPNNHVIANKLKCNFLISFMNCNIQ